MNALTLMSQPIELLYQDCAGMGNSIDERINVYRDWYQEQWSVDCSWGSGGTVYLRVDNNDGGYDVCETTITIEGAEIKPKVGFRSFDESTAEDWAAIVKYNEEVPDSSVLCSHTSPATGAFRRRFLRRFREERGLLNCRLT